MSGGEPEGERDQQTVAKVEQGGAGDEADDFQLQFILNLYHILCLKHHKQRTLV